MANRFRSLFLLLVTAGAASAAAIVTIPTGVHLSINGMDETSLLNLPAIQSGQNSFSLSSSVTIPGFALISSLGFTTFDDPFINYFMAVQNTTSSVETYNFTIINPYIGGPYTILHDSFTDSFTDGNSNGTVSIGIPTGSNFIAQPQVNGGNVDGQGSGCTQTGGGGFSGSCNSGPNLTSFPIPATSAGGTFGVAINFTLSPGDIYTFNGHVDLANATPEPATYTFMAAGLGVIFLLARRRRIFSF